MTTSGMHCRPFEGRHLVYLLVSKTRFKNYPVFYRALECGAKSPVLAFIPDQSWPDAPLLTMLGALDALYVPLEIREDVPARKTKASRLSVLGISTEVIEKAYNLDQGK